jgi:aconitate hydratase
MIRRECLRTLQVDGLNFTLCDINALEDRGLAAISKLPFCIKVLVENLLRKLDGEIVTEQDLLRVARWQKRYATPVEIPFHPARVLLQDYTGIPAVVDLAAMRDAMLLMGGDPARINPHVPVELVIDHSVQADFHGTWDCQELNTAREYARNGERYGFLKWAQKSFDNVKIIPPRSGICHQVNLEYLSRVIVTEENEGHLMAFPDTLVGADSHTTMINGVGVLGWGVGGIEAEAVMLGQPYFMAIPEVIGVRLTGTLSPGTTATDLVLYLTQALRKYGVVEKFVEYFGPGMKQLSVPDRATVANMAPEYGATAGFFPVDEKTIRYLRMTNRGDRSAAVEACAKALGLFYTGDRDPAYTDVVEIDLSAVKPAVAGPSRPHDRVLIQDLQGAFRSSLAARDRRRFHDIDVNGRVERIGDGSVVMAAITSCTNTSNPYVLMGAGLVARNAVKKGLRPPAHVKTVLAPGSKVVTRYLERAGLQPYLESIGFHTAGYGCMVCIGNSGSLHPSVEQAIKAHDLNVASVLSGNRNFEARIHQQIQSNFIGSPMLVVAFALAGRIDIDFDAEPVGIDPNGHPVFLRDLWLGEEEIRQCVAAHVTTELFQSEYSGIDDGDGFWRSLEVVEGVGFNWDPESSYVKAPPYFHGVSPEPSRIADITGARALLMLGDGVTTDHISPAGSIPESYPAGQHLISLGIRPADFNSYGARRGNHEVLVRGAFGNIRLKNGMVAPREGSFTRKYPENREMYVYEAAMAYQAEGVPLIVLGGREYGSGSSRDWAAKGPALLGVRAVLVESFERIHRSNLVGVGVLPLVFRDGQNCAGLGLDGSETYSIRGIENIEPRKTLQVTAVKADGRRIDFETTARLDTEVEVACFQSGGILPFVLRKMAKTH